MKDSAPVFSFSIVLTCKRKYGTIRGRREGVRMKYGVYLVWNILVFSLYGVDKYKAKHNLWRIKEKTLLGAAFLMGGAGALAGMQIFRHKTKHKNFTVWVPVFFVLNLIVLFGTNFAKKIFFS